MRIRVGRWDVDEAKGTILIFPGRTEYIEKYGRVARDFAEAGYSVAAVDWRGQGLADRLLEDPLLGHVEEFTDYQRDVAAFLDAVSDMPKPWFLVAHSMGGCIGCRALSDGLPVKCASFSAPMWGIQISAAIRPFAPIIAGVARSIGQGWRYAPGTDSTTYVRSSEFGSNRLTSDPEQYEYHAQQIVAEPRFALGGPSLTWLEEALREGRLLPYLPRPTVPVQTYLGLNEQIVSSDAIYRLHVGWDTAELITVSDAKHELMMELPDLRSIYVNGTIAFFDAA